MNRKIGPVGWGPFFAVVLGIALFAAIPASGAPGDAPDTIIDSGPGGPTNNPTPTFAFHSTQAGSTFECSVDKGNSSFGPCVEPTPRLDDGSYIFRVRAVNGEAIADETPAARAFTVDTVAPDTIIDSRPSGQVELGDLDSLTFAYHSTETGSTFECSVDEGVARFEPCKELGNDIGEGSYTFRVRATDPASNVDPSPATSDFHLVEPPPIYGKTVNLETVSGVVRVRPRGHRKFSVLRSPTQIRVGSAIDASQGSVRLVSAKSKGGRLQSADFHSGRFEISQPTKGEKPITVLTLDSELTCDQRAQRSVAVASGSKGNGLWGSGHGHYRSVGQHGSATVRGTIWFTEDRCDGTFFQVSRGVVTVRDFVKDKVVFLRKGSEYLAAAP